MNKGTAKRREAAEPSLGSGPPRAVENLDMFSNLMWGLCAASALSPLMNTVNMTTVPQELAFFSLYSGIVFLTVLRNFYVNRQLLNHHGEFYRWANPLYRGTFTWLLNLAIAAFFALGIFQYLPIPAALSLAACGLSLVLVGRVELSIFEQALRQLEARSAAGHANDTESAHFETGAGLLALYRFWLILDSLVAATGIVLALFFYLAPQLGRNAQLGFVCAALAILNIVDFVCNREFYFGPARPRQTADSRDT